MKLTANTQTKTTKTAYTEVSLPMALIRAVFLVYLFLLLVVLPLIFHKGYVDIADTKWKYYKLFTVGFISDYGIMIFPGCAVILIILFIWYAIDKKRNGISFRKPLITDYFVIGYMLVCCISTILAPVKTVVIEGYPGYYMGLYAQLSFCLLYLFASNICFLPSEEYLGSKENGISQGAHPVKDFFLTDKYLEVIPWIIIALMMVGSVPVMWIGIQNALGKDVFNMAAVSGVEVGEFRSTIGNRGILAEYITVVLVAGVYVFMYSKKTVSIMISGVWLILAFIETVCSRSMGILVGFFAVMFVYLILSFESPLRFAKYMMVIFLMGLAFGITEGLAYDHAGNIRILTEDILLLAIDKRVWVSVIIISAILALVGLLTHFVRKDKKPLRMITHIMRGISFLMLIGAIICVYSYIRMNTDGTLPDWLPASTNKNLIFHENWGSYRPRMWKFILNSFNSVIEGNTIHFLFGLGPDNLYILPQMTDLGWIVWGANSIVAYAHNEFINVYVNMGLLGLITYAGFFIITACYLIINKHVTKNKDKNDELSGVIHNEKATEATRILALSVLFGYVAQNSVGYQWVCVTTAAFVILGAGMARYRR